MIIIITINQLDRRRALMAAAPLSTCSGLPPDAPVNTAGAPELRCRANRGGGGARRGLGPEHGSFVASSEGEGEGERAGEGESESESENESESGRPVRRPGATHAGECIAAQRLLSALTIRVPDSIKLSRLRKRDLSLPKSEVEISHETFVQRRVRRPAVLLGRRPGGEPCEPAGKPAEGTNVYIYIERER